MQNQGLSLNVCITSTVGISLVHCIPGAVIVKDIVVASYSSGSVGGLFETGSPGMVAAVPECHPAALVQPLLSLADVGSFRGRAIRRVRSRSWCFIGHSIPVPWAGRDNK